MINQRARLYSSNAGVDMGILIQFHNDVMRHFVSLVDEMNKSFYHFSSPAGSAKYKIPYRVSRATQEKGFIGINSIPSMCKKDTNNGNGYYVNSSAKALFDSWLDIDTIGKFTYNLMQIVTKDLYRGVKFDDNLFKAIEVFIKSNNLSTRSHFKICRFYSYMLPSLKGENSSNMRALLSLILGSIIVDKRADASDVVNGTLHVTTTTFLRHVLFVRALIKSQFTTTCKNPKGVKKNVLLECMKHCKVATSNSNGCDVETLKVHVIRRT